MILIEFIILGLIQGLTETVPISSSGHLMIIKYLFNLNVDYNNIAILTNFGSLLAVIILFYKDIKAIINDSFLYLKTKDKNYKNTFNYFLFILLGCIPAGISGLIISKLNLFSKIENNIKIVGFSLIITSVLLFIVRKYNGYKNDNNITFKDALFIGCFQILGLFPGISRSGSTIVASLISDLRRETAFKYSFMLYIPISIAATMLELTQLNIQSNLMIYYFISIFISFVVTLLVTKTFKQIVNSGKLVYFSVYCFIVGLLVILFL